MSRNLSSIRHVEAQDPLAAEITSQPTRAIELRLRQLEQMFLQQSALAAAGKIIIPNVTVAPTVALYDAVYFDPNSNQYEQGLAGVTVKADTFSLNPNSVAFGIVVAKSSSTVADVIVGGYDTLDETKTAAMLETGEIFKAGLPYYLSARQLGKLTQFPPNFKVQMLMTSSDHFVVHPVYADPDAVEVTYRNTVGMRPVGGIRTVPDENNRYQIVGFDGIENYDTGDATKWRLTGDVDSNVQTHKDFGFVVADAEVTVQPTSPIMVELTVDSATGLITLSSAESFAELGTAEAFNTIVGAGSNLDISNYDAQRTYVVLSKTGVTLGNITFKFTHGNKELTRKAFFKFPDSFQGWKMVNDPSTPAAYATVVGGAITAITVTNGGYGYTTAPTVVIDSGDNNSATAEAIINDSGVVTSVNVITSGADYGEVSISFTGGVKTLTVTDPGSGYITAPSITIAAPAAGDQASAELTFSDVQLTQINRSAGGSGYTSAPTAYVASNGDNAGGKVIAEISTNAVISIPVTEPGAGYTVAPQFGFSGGGGCAVAGAPTIVGGVITAISVSAPGAGYTSVPDVCIVRPAAVTSATEATATARLKAVSVRLASGGQNYEVGDVITLTGGEILGSLQLQVTAINNCEDNGVDGEVDMFNLVSAGVYSEVPSGAIGSITTSAYGSGATFLVTWGVESIVVNNGGTGYVGGTSVTFQNGGQVSAVSVLATDATLDRIDVIVGGSNFTTPPTIKVFGGSAVLPATIGTPVIAGAGQVSSLVIAEPGSSFDGVYGEVSQVLLTSVGYSYTAPTPEIPNPVVVTFLGDCEEAAQATVVLGGIQNSVVGFTLSSGGRGYRNPPLVVITDSVGNGVGAQAVAVLNRSVGFSGGGGAEVEPPAMTGNSLTTGEVAVSNPGHHYTHQPAVVFTNKSGGGAAATANVNAGAVTTIDVTSGGSRYAIEPIVELVGGGGVGATAVANVDFNTGQVTTVDVTLGGSGYTTAPEVVFHMGSGAVGYAVMKLADEPVVINSAGTGYAVGDNIALDYQSLYGDGWAIAVEHAVFRVATVNADNGIASVDLISPGSFYVLPKSPLLTRGGTWLPDPPNPSIFQPTGNGSGATFTPNWVIDYVLITNGGSNYPAAPVISLSGGGHAEASYEVGGHIETVNITSAGSGYTRPPLVSISGGDGSGASVVATISGDGGSRHSSALQIWSYNDDFDTSTVVCPKPTNAEFYYNILVDPVLRTRWPSVPVEKTTMLLNGLEVLTGKLDEGTEPPEFTEVDCDVGLSRRTLFWTTSHMDGCPWDRFYEQIRVEPGTGGRDNVIPGTGDEVTDTLFRWWEHTYKYEPNRNKAWVYVNRLSRFHQSGRVVSLTAESPLQLVNLDSGADSGGNPQAGQLLLRLNNQTNILSGPSTQIELTSNGQLTPVYQNLSGRNVFISSFILEVVFQQTSAGQAVVTANNARVTLGTRTGNYRDIVGNVTQTSIIQQGVETRLVGANQVKELFPDSTAAYTVIAPNDIVYLRVDQAAGGPILSQLVTVRTKGHVL